MDKKMGDLAYRILTSTWVILTGGLFLAFLAIITGN